MAVGGCAIERIVGVKMLEQHLVRLRIESNGASHRPLAAFVHCMDQAGVRESVKVCSTHCDSEGKEQKGTVGTD